MVNDTLTIVLGCRLLYEWNLKSYTLYLMYPIMMTFDWCVTKLQVGILFINQNFFVHIIFHIRLPFITHLFSLNVAYPNWKLHFLLQVRIYLSRVLGSSSCILLVVLLILPSISSRRCQEVIQVFLDSLHVFDLLVISDVKNLWNRNSPFR